MYVVTLFLVIVALGAIHAQQRPPTYDTYSLSATITQRSTGDKIVDIKTAKIAYDKIQQRASSITFTSGIPEMQRLLKNNIAYLASPNIKTQTYDCMYGPVTNSTDILRQSDYLGLFAAHVSRFVGINVVQTFQGTPTTANTFANETTSRPTARVAYFTSKDKNEPLNHITYTMSDDFLYLRGTTIMQVQQFTTSVVDDDFVLYGVEDPATQCKKWPSFEFVQEEFAHWF